VTDSGLKLQRHPLAFGITYWGPLPETAGMYLMWDGPGSGLSLYASDPAVRGALGNPVRHRSASGPFTTVRAAEKAAHAFAAAGLDPQRKQGRSR
jgi:hypothetical protein